MTKLKTSAKTKYFLDEKGRFVIENYHNAGLFTNFFPGIAGLFGIPMWVFYVNRGQAISSFGIESKDKAIMEFQPANKAYRLTSLHGFRTFLKIKSGPKTRFYEPFQNNLTNKGFRLESSMAVTSHDLTIEETNVTLGLAVRVNYFTLPEEPYAALVRQVTIRNLSRKPIVIEAIDGMPAIMPYGLNDWLSKHMSRTAEAWNQVTNLEHKAPYFNLRVAIADTAKVTHIPEGNFYFSFLKDGAKTKLLDPIVRSSAVFGTSSDLIYPEAFLSGKNFKNGESEATNKKTPCAMSFAALKIPAKSEKTFVSLMGNVKSYEDLNRAVQETLAEGFIEKKARRNQEIVEEIKNSIFTASSSREFNLYAGQTFLDNVLRGGLPVSFDAGKGKTTLNVYSRKHGDPERDYNYFVLAPTYLSQGNGSYRDVNQNRRNDIWFNRNTRELNLVNFLNLIQADGYNPLVIKGTTFRLDKNKIREILEGAAEEKDRASLAKFLEGDFLLGKILSSVDQEKIHLKVSPQEFLKRILTHASRHEAAEHGEGFWVDHWTYNLDLIESYLSVYPEEKHNILLEEKSFHFYRSSHYVSPRQERYVLTPEGGRQYHGVAKGAWTSKDGEHKLRTQGGKGSVYETTLFVKLLCLIANKAASLDPSGIGMEMEADRPGWYDALNGLPGLLGSSTAEVFELKRLSLFLLDALEGFSLEDEAEVNLFEELCVFISELTKVLGEEEPFSYWSKSNDIKEHYRAKVREGITGAEKALSFGEIRKFLNLVLEKTDKAISRARDEKGRYTTYLEHEIVKYDLLSNKNKDGFPFIRPLEFKKRNLPLFLEGFVHAIKIAASCEEARRIYHAVRTSPLYDTKLKMYKVNASLSAESENIGRTRVFPPGWLENESIWLHMEYKFFLELLRLGLYKEFYENMKAALVPFLDPAIYGRSILENSSFIVSGAQEDPTIHGRGFVARLSGTTAEFLHIWLLMNAGNNPFGLDTKGKLSLMLKPILERWLFTKKEAEVLYQNKKGEWEKIILPKNTYAFNFMNGTLAVYHNPRRCDTFGAHKASIQKILLTYPDGHSAAIASPVISAPFSYDVRDGKLARMDVYFK